MITKIIVQNITIIKVMIINIMMIFIIIIKVTIGASSHQHSKA